MYINLSTGVLKITSAHIQNILNTIWVILQKIFVSPRNLANLKGQIVSTKYAMHDIVQLRTRFLYKSIERSPSWDKTFNISNFVDTLDEIMCWKFNLTKHNSKVINTVGRVLLILWRSSILTTLTPPPSSLLQILSNLPSSTLFVALFIWLNVSSHHSCVILLNNIMDLDLSSLGTLIWAAPCYVFYATRHHIYQRLDIDDMVFASTLIWYHTHRQAHSPAHIIEYVSEHIFN